MSRIKRFLGIVGLFLISLSNYSQSENEFLKNVDWINQNPSEIDNKEFVSKTANSLRFQMFNYPNFSINISGMQEIDSELKKYKFERYFQVVYSLNQLVFKIENKNKFSNLNACDYAMRKLIESYLTIIENDPTLKIEILDSYAEMSEKDLKRKLKKII